MRTSKKMVKINVMMIIHLRVVRDDDDEHSYRPKSNRINFK